MTNTYVYNTTIGQLQIKTEEKYVLEAKFIETDLDENNNKLGTKIKEYMNGNKLGINVKIKINGTDFQKKVWKEIIKIPYGETRTYKQIAEAIGHPKSYRAVANACGQNKIVLMIPCHRVVGCSNIGGYSYGINKKKWLLELESLNI